MVDWPSARAMRFSRVLTRHEGLSGTLPTGHDSSRTRVRAARAVVAPPARARHVRARASVTARASERSDAPVAVGARAGGRRRRARGSIAREGPRASAVTEARHGAGRRGRDG